MITRILLLAAFVITAFAQESSPRAVNTMADLARLSPVASKPKVEVLGYYAPGDGGGGVYFATNTVTGTNAYGGRIRSGKAGWSWQLDSDKVSAKQFGAVGDGNADDTISIQAWMDYGAKHMVLPMGVFKITGTVWCRQNNINVDWYGWTKAANGVSYNQIVFGERYAATNVVAGAINPVVLNVTINGHGSGGHDGNALNALEYFPSGVSPVFGGAGFTFSSITNLVVTGLSVRNPPLFAVSIIGCDQVQCTGVNIDSGYGNNSSFYNGKNQDGIHWTDCSNVTASNITASSADDNFAITSNWANVGNYVLNNLRGRHRMAGNASGYRVLATNFRITRDLGGTVTNVVINNGVFDGEHGGFTLQSLTTEPSVSLVRFNNCMWTSLTNSGTATSQAKLWGAISGCSDVQFNSCTWSNLNRYAFIQNATNITFYRSVFAGIITNPWTSTIGALLIDGPNAVSVGSVSVENCEFYNMDQQAIRFLGLSGSTRKINGPIRIRGNKFYNGGRVADPTGAGFAAIRVTGSSELVDISDNHVLGWRGHAVDLLDNLSVALSRNVIDGAGSTVTNTYGILADTTAGSSIQRVDLSDNVVVNYPSSGMFIRNAQWINGQGNTLSGNQRLTTANAAWILGINGDGGANPVTSTWCGILANNLFRGVGSGTGLAVSSANAPAYTGSPMQMAGNRFHSFTTTISRDGSGYSIPYVFSEPIVVGSNTELGSAGNNVFRLATTSNASHTNTVYIEKIVTASGTSSATQTAASMIARNQGNGGHTGTINPLSVTASHDQSTGNNANQLRGVLSTVRWTSGGNVSSLEAFAAQPQGSGSGVATEAVGFSARSPVLSGGGTIATARGVLIYPQLVAGVGSGVAIDQQGASDLNRLSGLTIIGSNGQQITRLRRGNAILTAGIATVSDANVTANSLIYLTHKTPGGTPGWLVASNIVANTSFQIQSSSATDTSTVSWLLVEP